MVTSPAGIPGDRRRRIVEDRLDVDRARRRSGGAPAIASSGAEAAKSARRARRRLRFIGNSVVGERRCARFGLRLSHSTRRSARQRLVTARGGERRKIGRPFRIAPAGLSLDRRSSLLPLRGKVSPRRARMWGRAAGRVSRRASSASCSRGAFAICGCGCETQAPRARPLIRSASPATFSRTGGRGAHGHRNLNACQAPARQRPPADDRFDPARAA